MTGDVHRYGVPRSDLQVTVGGITIRPEDEALYAPFFAKVTEQDLRLRFFAPITEFSHAFIARFTQLDYARAMAFIAIEESSGQMLGVVRLHANANYDTGEYAILLRSDCKGRGLGWLLMQMIIDYRERDVLQGLVSGLANKQIAFNLGISPRTVEIYRANLMTKMQASSLSDLVRMALVAGILDWESNAEPS